MLLLNDNEINEIENQTNVCVRSMIMIPVFDLKQLNDDILNGKIISKIDASFDQWSKYDDACPELDRLYNILSVISNKIVYSNEGYEKKLSSLNNIDIIYDQKIRTQNAYFCIRINRIFGSFQFKFKFVFKELIEQRVKEAYCLSAGLSEEFFDNHIKGFFFMDIIPLENLNNMLYRNKQQCQALVACHELYRNIFMTKIFDGLFLKDVELPDKIKMSKLCINLIFLSRGKNLDKILAYTIDDPMKSDFMMYTNLYYEGIDANVEFSYGEDFDRLVSIADFISEYAKNVSFIWNEKLLENKDDDLLYNLQISSFHSFHKKTKVKNLSESFLCRNIMKYLPSSIIRNLNTKIFPMIDCYGRESEFKSLKDMPENNEIIIGSRYNNGGINLLLRMNRNSAKEFQNLLNQIQKKKRLLHFELERAAHNELERRILITTRPLTIGVYEAMIDQFIEDKFGVKSHLKQLRASPITRTFSCNFINNFSYVYEANFGHSAFLRLSKKEQEEHKKYCFYRIYLNDLIEDRNRNYSNLYELNFDALTGMRPMLNTWELYKDKIIDIS